MRSRRCLIPLIALVVGCAGNVRTELLRPDALVPGRELSGVIVYQPQYVKLTYAFTTRLDDKGKVLGRATDGTCQQLTQREDVVLMADLTKPALIRNSAGWFSAAKFSVTLNNGMLASVNSEPTQKLSDLLTSSAAVIKEAALALGLVAPSVEACNANPTLVAFQRIE